MKSDFYIKILVIIQLLLVVLMIVFFTSTISDINKIDKTDVIKSLQLEIDSLNTVNSEAMSTIDSLTNSVVSINYNVKNINYRIKRINNNIEQLKLNTGEKINSIDTFNNTSIDLFFSGRYGIYKNN